MSPTTKKPKSTDSSLTHDQMDCQTCEYAWTSLLPHYDLPE